MGSKYLERKSQDFPIWWKVAHISLYGIIFILGLANFIPFGSIEGYFRGSCPLYSNITLQKSSSNDSFVATMQVDPTGQKICSYCLYSSVASTIYAFILAWFYVLCGKGGNSDQGLPKPWRLVCPTFILSLAFTIISMVSSVYATNGFSFLCKWIQTNSKLESCSIASDKPWNGYPNVQGFYGTLVLAEATSWCITSFWIISSLVLLARCCFPADFEVIRDDPEDDKKCLHDQGQG